ncbi:hypothetical protein MJO28_006806 [Puccinia striiformis f. sp. tritici]|uniref:Uncharacterized protein n=1 Tax=Puccinia striiformis f. sp. tritici TaxID=168172 RepID=A0ACC0EJ97_9BASI|nr:hypothetical protein Pst134EB_012944 [Puccinia striiformis f. sp. tritici]KAI7954259.1 hypothetical protein MJO28_006806 [Puccinia striiformis f. sp. tritici]KAI7958563.1 hypothetical protein MJO29_006780 [Puccinia striiformis f. sp. tritici]KAI9619447.1 hypothetical protein H4Q26_014209 [Puccinia striiformis f. sp. tritici PST-130]KAI9631231.1 hypothetical protein KEM48_013160 [Puccinia striiformis f. sp. tritici PST-130]
MAQSSGLKVDPVFCSINAALYDPQIVLDSSDFKVLEDPAEIAKCSEANENIACCYNDKKQIHMVKKPMPKAHPGQVLLHIRATGICGSDVHFWKHSRVGEKMVVRDECGAGHESAGEVIGLGEGVIHLKIGDRVAVEAGVPCSKPTCEQCRKGGYNACPEMIFFSTPPFHGLLTRFHAHPACWVHKIPDHISYEEGSLLEPLAVALAGIERAGVRLGDPVLICGAGPIGLVTLLACHAAGACPIAITDLSTARLDFAKRLLPSVSTIQIERGTLERDVAAQVKEAMGCNPRVALECTGFESSIAGAIYSVSFGGKVFVIGVGGDKVTLPFSHMSENEIDLQFQFRYANQYPKAIRLVSSGLIDLKPLVTHRFQLQKAVEAFQTSSDITSGSIKVQIIDF